MNLILHITTHSDWETAVSHPPYTTASLQSDGFIHCSTPAQAVYAANEHFKGQTGFKLLCIDEDLVTAKVVYEDCYETGLKFPHIYGPLNLDAVTAVLPFPPDADGRFTRLPENTPGG